MDNERFKAQLIRDKEWLRELYENENIASSKRILNFASDSKIDTLLKFIHLVSNGVIKITKENFDKIGSTQFKIIQRHFESKIAINKLLRSERRAKLQKLTKLLPALRFLLFTLFNAM